MMRGKLKYIIIIFLVLIYVDRMSGQEQSLSSYVINKDVTSNASAQSHLSSNIVTAIDQDENGMMWFGTKRGLNSYDSHTFEEYNQADGIINATITDIRSVGDTLFIGTEKGLSIYDVRKKQATNFFADIDSLALPDNYIYNISRPIKDKLVISTKDGTSVYNLKTKEFYIPEIDNYAPSYEIRAVEYVEYNDSWVVATSNGLVLYQDKNQSVQHFYSIKDYDNTLSDNELRCLHKISDEIIFIGTANGLSLFNAKEKSIKRIDLNALTEYMSSKLDVSNIIDLAEDEIMISTYTNGLYIYNYQENTARQITKFDKRNAISENYVFDVYKDNLGSVWVATFTGLNRFENKLTKFSNVSIFENGAMLSINYFLELQDSNILIGTESGIKVFDVEDKSIVDFKTYFNSKEDYLESMYVYSFYLDEDNRVWVGTRNNGLYIYDIETDELLDVSKEFDIDMLRHAVVREMVMDEYDNMWVATNIGLCRINMRDKTHLFYNKGRRDDSSLPNDDIFDLMLADDMLYVTTGSGLSAYHYDTDDFETYRLPDSLTKDDVVKNNGFFDIVEGEDGRYYIGSYSNGMMAFSPDTKQFRTSKRADSIGMVYAIVPDNNGFLWASTSKGIMKYSLETKNITTYDVSDGLQGNEFTPNAFLKSKDDFIFFGGFNGFNYFKPEEILLETRTPKVIVSKMMTNNGMKYRYLEDGDTIHLSHKDNSFEIEFATLNLLRKKQAVYSYMLENYDKTWTSETSDHRYVDYDRLRPGTYVFKLTATNEVGVSTEEPMSLTIIIYPAWYQRWIFKIAVLMLFVLLILFIIRQRYKIVYQKREQKRVVSELETQMLQLKQKTLQLQMNPHVIFNTLNSIQQYILNHDTENAASYLSSFSKLMRKILNNSNERYVTLADELEAVSLYLQLESMRLGNRFSYQIEIDKDIDVDNVEIAPLIVQPFVENAIIHGLVPKKENCVLKIKFKKLTEEKLLCVVEDNGIGRKYSEKMKKEKGSSHKSYGMSITRRRLETLTKISNDDFSVEIVDLYDSDGNAEGTRVNIIISYHD